MLLALGDPVPQIRKLEMPNGDRVIKRKPIDHGYTQQLHYVASCGIR